MIDAPKLLVFVGFIDIYKWLKQQDPRRKYKMKKLITLILITALCLMSLSALAATNGDDMVFMNLGITLHFPDLFREIQGTIELTEADEVTDDEGTAWAFITSCWSMWACLGNSLTR